MKIINYYSPNFDIKKRSIKAIKVLVIHYTGMQSERESLSRLTNPKSKVSSHFVISKKGKIYRLISDDRVAWHAGKSFWGKLKNLNKSSIGIELVNKGHEFGYTKFTKHQLLSLIKICKMLIKKYKINKKNVVGHSDIAPIRKIDPGEKFPWFKLAKNNIGIWHDYKYSFLKKYRKIKISKNKDRKKFIKNLNKIGYFISENNNKRVLSKTIRAFQMHYRQELVNGILDKECEFIAQNLSKKT
tara:strand:+ start:63 stop:791 length:729 start_codon:yes stop_codon:yes gene_type:complete